MPIALVLLGAQGSGKGTIGAEFAKRGYTRIVMGEILQDKKENDPKFVAEFFDTSRDMNRGDLQSDDAVKHCLVEALHKARNNNLVLDGCIRSVAQVEMVSGVLIDRYYDIVFIHLDCSMETAISRIEKRRDEMIKNGQKPRLDDLSRDAIGRRLNIFYNTIGSIIRAIEQKPVGRSVYTVSAETDPNRVIGRIDRVLFGLSLCSVTFRTA